MSKHHTAASQANPHTSTIDSTVIEGEVLGDHVEESIDEKISRGRAYSNSKAKPEPKSNNDYTESSVTTHSWFAKYRSYVLGLLMFIVVILVLFATRPNTAWQIQHINALQTDVAQLYQDNEALEARLTSQAASVQKTVETAVVKALADTENQPLVSQADLDGIKQSMQLQLEQLQERLLGLKETVTPQLQKSQEGIDQIVESANEITGALKPSKETEEQLKLLEQKLQIQMGEIGVKLAKLFDSNAHQSTLSAQQALTSSQIQQWIVAINTQWMLQGRVEQTSQQLLALEQAIGLSDLTSATALARLIGQDLANLDTLQKASNESDALNTQDLKQAIRTLTLTDIKATDIINNTANGVVDSKGERISVGEEISSESALDQLIERFGQMVSLKKRDTSTEQTKVESLVMHDVLVQRGLLLVDRIDWALQTQSTAGLTSAIADLEGFIASHFKAQVTEFTALLQPFKSQSFKLRQPLAILSLQSE